MACKQFKLFNGLHSMDSSFVNGYRFHLAYFRLNSKFSPSDNGVSRPKAALFSGGGDLLSYSNGSDEISGDLDRPTEGFASIPEAIEDIRQGKMVLVVDDEDRENEGDLIMAAQLTTPEAMAFIVKHGTGIVCVSMKEEDLERLELPLMVNSKDNDEKHCTAFTVTVVAKHGTTTGISAHDRVTTALALASRDSKPGDFNRPGYIFPLKYREGGALKRVGHTEASIDLVVLAGLEPVAVLCAVVDEDGSMARLPKLHQFAEHENLKIISVADSIRYRREREKLVAHAAVAQIPTMSGPFAAYSYRSLSHGFEYIAMVKDGSYEGDIESTGSFKVPVRALNIIWGNDTRFWRFMYLPDDETRVTGFNEVALLVQVNWIEVTGKVPKAVFHRAGSVVRYEILYLIKFRSDAFGWHSIPVKFKLRLTNKSGKEDHTENDNNNNNNDDDEEDVDEKCLILEPYREKQEVWHEIPGGQFSVSNSQGFVEFGMFEIDSAWWKGNMVLAGVKIKPIAG